MIGEQAVPAIPRARVRLIFGALMLVLLLAMLDSTIVATALPTIAGDLGGIAHLPWVVTAYLLSSTVAGPLYGKLSDLYGSKRILQAAIVIFIVGSALCGVAQDMGQLIAFRSIQGLGGGGLIVTTIAVIGDILAPREQGRYQVYTSSTLALATMAGPLLGGFFVDNLSWRWIFYVNLPLGLVALPVIGVVLTTRAATVRPRIDYAGAVLLSVALSTLVLYVSLGAQTIAWLSWQGVLLLTTSLGATVWFLFVERRVSEPVLPLHLFRIRTISVGSPLNFVAGVALFGAVTFLPSYLQVVKGESPTRSGLHMVALMGGLVAVSIVAGQTISRRGRYRALPILGTLVTGVGLAACATLTVDTSIVVVIVFMLVVGGGIGALMPALMIATQNAVSRENLGVATSSVTLFRLMGGSVGVSIFGAIFVSRLADEIGNRLPSGAALTTTDPATINRLAPALHDPYVAAFAAALQPVFFVASVISLVALAIAWLLPDVPLRETSHATLRSARAAKSEAPAG